MLASIKELEKIMTDIETQLGVPPINYDPDDTWAFMHATLFRSHNVSKMRCPDCGYVYTRPFESECTLCRFKKGKVHPPQFTLNLDEIAARSAPATGTEEKKPKEKPKKEREGAAEEKKPKAPTPAAPAEEEDPFQLFNKAKIQVARLSEVQKHPNADKLLIAKATVGDEVKNLVTGLALHYAPADLEGRLVCCVTNLKPAKLVGIESQVMLFAATDKATNKIVVLDPPAGSVSGDVISVEGHPAAEGALPIIQKKYWDKIVEAFFVKGNLATYRALPLRTARGPVGCPVTEDSPFH